MSVTFDTVPLQDKSSQNLALELLLPLQELHLNHCFFARDFLTDLL